ncbi:MAG: PepSY domain-containing protein [Cyanobacteria bacterium J06623_4]
MAISKAQIRKWHRSIAPIMVLPLVLTAITGTTFQLAVNSGKAADFFWLLQIHKGHYGPVNLSFIYPFLNGIGLLVLVFTGLTMWLQTRRPKKKAQSQGSAD